MLKFISDYKINFLFLFISFICLICAIGLGNISFTSTDWLHDGNESAFEQLAWFFFKNDIWRFPLGSNPNYGDEISSSIVFSDSIPILALFFKLLKPIIPENFQYFSFWYLICFYFQLFFSFKILKHFTNSTSLSLIGSIFFLIAPIFIFRFNYHASASGHWLLLFTLYLGLTYKIDKAKLTWFLLIIFSSLILYNFTVIILSSYLLIRIYNFNFNKKYIYELIRDFILLGILLFLTLYLVGYFQIRLVDSLGLGFGYHKLNLLSMFDPVMSTANISWSWFLPDIKLSDGEELEGFNYLGLGQILMLFFTLILFLNKKFKSNLFDIKNNKEIKSFIIISLIFTLWALSNKISFGSYTIIDIPLNKYIFALLSIAKATGRMFWIVNYFLLILSIIIIYKCFGQKNSLLIISIFLVIQIADVSAGLKSRISLITPLNATVGVKDPLWNNLFEKNKILKTTYPSSWPGMLYNFTHAMEKNSIEKTNLVAQARTNRKAAAEARYLLYDKFRKKDLSQNTVYIINDLSHLRHLKYMLKNENIGFFFRDNVWSMVKNKKELMNDNDKKEFSKIELKSLQIDKRENLNFKNKNSYYGLGWSHNLGKSGIWSEGQISTLLFRTEKDYENLNLEILCKPYINKKNKVSEFDIYVNDLFNKKIQLSDNNLDEKIEIQISKEMIKNNKIIIDFVFKNLISPYEVFESPDSRKLGILIKNIKIFPI